MSNLRSLVAAPLLALALGCTSTPDHAVPATDSTRVQVAVLQHLFANNDSSLGRSADSYCVGVGAAGLIQTDPLPSLLRELQPGFPDAVPLSQCSTAPAPGGGWQVVDELSRLPSIAFLVDEPSFDGADRARVYAEYHESDRFATGYDCTAARGAEGWAVVECDSGFVR